MNFISALFTRARRTKPAPPPIDACLSIVNSEPDFDQPVSQLATGGQCESAAFKRWFDILKPDIDHRWLPKNQPYNRKIWEWAYILQVLQSQGFLREDAKGLGFGVGREPLIAVLARQGCRMVATDLPNEDAVQRGWDHLGQYSFNLADLNRYDICPPELFSERVQFTPIDMTAINKGLTDFDFVYSSCALEHLGSLERGLEFIENSLDCIRPGGLAVHTTEYNLSSNDKTLATGPTVLYRERDILSLADRLAEKHDRMTINLSPGSSALDRHYDVPPYFEQGPHLKLLMDQFVTTSIGLMIRKRP